MDDFFVHVFLLSILRARVTQAGHSVLRYAGFKDKLNVLSGHLVGIGSLFEKAHIPLGRFVQAILHGELGGVP